MALPQHGSDTAQLFIAASCATAFISQKPPPPVSGGCTMSMRARVDQPLEFLHAVMRLAGRQPDRRPRAQLGVAGDVMRRQRLLGTIGC